MRLQKYLAGCGVCSRRKAEELIAAGRVTVNGRRAVLGVKVGPCDDVFVDGVGAVINRKKVWVMLHKPEGYITSAKDELGRKTVLDLVKVNERVFPVGRLDYDTSGLLLLTNDGGLANKLAHPSYGVEKVYIVTALRPLSKEALLALRNGVMVDGKKTRPAKVRTIKPQPGAGIMAEITITEGRNRIVRKMFAAVGNKVVALKRVAIGGLRLGELSKGEFRHLTAQEVETIATYL